MKKIQAAIIGMGRMGKTRYEAMLKHGGYDIVAICDSNTSLLDGYHEKKYSDWKELLENENLDAAFVCTYNVMIPEIVCTALEMGCNVFSEKPPGRCLADVLRMKASYENNKKVLKFGFNHRYHNSIIEAKSLIDSGIFGNIVSARGVYGKAGSKNYEQEWRNDIAISGGGILLDQGIHLLDLMNYFMGEFSEAVSEVSNVIWKDVQTEDSVFAILKTKDHKVASLHSCAIQWKHKFDLDIICEKGSLVLNGLLTSTRSYGEETLTYYKKDLECITGRLGRPKEHTLCFDEDSSWVYEVEEFYDAVVNGTEIINGTINDAIKVMELVEKIYHSN